MVSILQYAIQFSLLFSINRAQSCPNGWTTFDDSCYLFPQDRMNFLKAEHYCRQNGSHLVHVETAEENNFIKTFDKLFKDSDHWIGLNDIVNEGHWVWSDTDTPYEFHDWYPGQPNAGTSANCVVIVYSVGYKWADRACSDSYPPICEKSQLTNGEIVG